jgi:hypothetical protein
MPRQLRLEKMFTVDPPEKCAYCETRTLALCDFVLPNGERCSRPVCREHRNQFEDSHFCKGHDGLSPSDPPLSAL